MLTSRQDHPVIEQEKRYDVYRNRTGDIMIKIRARLDDACAPKLVYAGGEHALLYRNLNNTIILDYIHPAIRTDFMHARRVLVVESNDNAIVREYVIDVKKVKELPSIQLEETL